MEGTGGGGMWWGLINSAGLKNGVVCGFGGCFEVAQVLQEDGPLRH